MGFSSDKLAIQSPVASPNVDWDLPALWEAVLQRNNRHEMTRNYVASGLRRFPGQWRFTAPNIGVLYRR